MKSLSDIFDSSLLNLYNVLLEKELRDKKYEKYSKLMSKDDNLRNKDGKTPYDIIVKYIDELIKE